MERNLDVHKCESLAVQRFNHRSRYAGKTLMEISFELAAIKTFSLLHLKCVSLNASISCVTNH